MLELPALQNSPLATFKKAQTIVTHSLTTWYSTFTILQFIFNYLFQFRLYLLRKRIAVTLWNKSDLTFMFKYYNIIILLL